MIYMFNKILVSGKILLLTLSFFIIGCTKEPAHSIRIRNGYQESMGDVRINSKSYGQVNTGSTTAYKPVEEGDFTLSGSFVTGKQLSGSGSVQGQGTHKWTLTITSAGGVAFAEDK